MKTDDELQPLDEALEEAHHFLHACERDYHSPSAFRLNLNAFIQAARNVTFRLQSLKAGIPQFDDWYSAWQDHLRADPIMLWVHNARTEVVKRKGLTTMSTARYSLIYSYDGATDETIEVPVETSTADILFQAIGRVPFNVRDRVLLTIERQWVAESLPEQELLSALGTCVLTLAALVNDARERSNGVKTTNPEDAIRSFQRPVCLTTLDQARVIRIHPGTGDVYTVGAQPIPAPSDEEGRQQVRKYGWPEESVTKYASADPLERAEGLAELSVRTLKVDGYHVSFALIRGADGWWRPVAFAPEDQLDKYILWHHIASLVRERRADALLFVGEFWAAPFDNLLKSGASDIETVPGRREQLVVFVETQAGIHRAWITPFRHRLGRITVEEQQVDDSYRPPMLEPVREVWRSSFSSTPAEGKRPVLLGTKIPESRLVDRVRASGLRAPTGAEPSPEAILGLVSNASAFVVDDVALYLTVSAKDVLSDLGSMSDMQLGSMPADFFMESVKPLLSVANPFPSAWGVACEARSAAELKDDEKKRDFSHPDEVWEAILGLAERFERILTTSLIVEHVPYAPVGPVANAFFGIQAHGQARVLGFNHGLTADLMGVNEADAPRLASSLMAPATAAIQLLNRGIAARNPFRPSRGARRRHLREHGVSLMPYEIVKVDLPARDS
jgi:hypothetical protein